MRRHVESGTARTVFQSKTAIPSSVTVKPMRPFGTQIPSTSSRSLSEGEVQPVQRLWAFCTAARSSLTISMYLQVYESRLMWKGGLWSRITPRMDVMERWLWQGAVEAEPEHSCLWPWLSTPAFAARSQTTRRGTLIG